jgi:hypothetical protein
MRLRARRLRWPEWLTGAGGLALLAVMLLVPWYQLTLASAPPGPTFFVAEKVDGWNGLSHARWLLLLTILLALGAAFFQAQRRAPALPVTLSLIASVIGAFTTLWLIVRVVVSPAGGREIGGWLGLLAVAVITYGGFASVRLEGIDPADGPGEIPTVGLARGRTT